MSNEQVKWKVDYWCDDSGNSTIEKWFDELTDQQFKSVAKEMKLLELCGNSLRLPHSRCLTQGYLSSGSANTGIEFIILFYPREEF